MTKTTNPPLFTRRAFLVTAAAGFTFAVTPQGLVSVAQSKSAAAFEANAWVTINGAGKIFVQVAACEMGQGPNTVYPVMLAEELDAAWEDMVPVQITSPKPAHGTPYFGGLVYTSASRGVTDYYMPLRHAGAQARLMLMRAVSEHWHVPIEELTTRPSRVVHQKSGREVNYGDIVTTMHMPEAVPPVDGVSLKDPADFRFIGHDMPRLDVPAKTDGSAQYTIDVQVPDMVYAAMLYPPVEGETPRGVDTSEAMRVPGVNSVEKLPHALAVIGTTVEATHAGKAALRVTWSETSPFRTSCSETCVEEYAKAARDFSRQGRRFRDAGDVEEAMKTASKTLSAEYRCDYVYHAQMEPLNATVSINEAEDGAEIWVGTQSQSLALMTAAQALDTTTDKIKLNQLYLGGGFGRRAELEPTYLLDAIALSQRLHKPVKVMWSREDDVKNGWFRPAAAQILRAGFDEQGDVTAWSHRVAAPSVLEFYNHRRWAMIEDEGVDGVVMHGSQHENYDVPNVRAEHIVMDREARLSPWRGVGSGYTRFAVESFVDELAREQEEDPLRFRLERLVHTERARRALLAVADESDWQRTRHDRGLGLALAEYHGALATGVFEVSVDDKTGKIKVHNVWAITDVGLAVQPANTRYQMEGGLLYGISAALTECITIENGQVQQSNFHDYSVMRMADAPDIHVRLIDSGDTPFGVGEIAVPLTAAGIANAVAHLTGIRLRHLPFTPDRVKSALKS